jgi:hypothetical protein
MKEIYFGDGAASEYKNRKNVANLVTQKRILELLQSDISSSRVMTKVLVML